MKSTDNIYVTRLFRDWEKKKTSKKVEVVNKLLEKLGFWVRLTGSERTGLMTNVEQRMNMYHLLSQVLAYGVEGHVELGCHVGESAAMFRKILDEHDPASCTSTTVSRACRRSDRRTATPLSSKGSLPSGRTPC